MRGSGAGTLVSRRSVSRLMSGKGSSQDQRVRSRSWPFVNQMNQAEHETLTLRFPPREDFSRSSTNREPVLPGVLECF